MNNDDKIEIFMGKIDERTVNIQKDVIEIKDNIKLQNGRIRKVENKQYFYSGIATFLGAGLAVFWNKLNGK